jgi:hypothetical protein
MKPIFDFNDLDFALNLKLFEFLKNLHNFFFIA